MSLLADFLTSHKIKYSTGVMLKDISSFKIGGRAEIVCYPATSRQVCELVQYCIGNNIAYMPFGKCSNVLFPDCGLKTLIIKTDLLCTLICDGTRFEFGSGVLLSKASRFCTDNNCTGFEFAYGIPGSIGGAFYMNAGAYGGEISKVAVEAEYVDEQGNLCRANINELDFGNRHSMFTDRNCIITKCVIKLSKGDKAESQALIDKLTFERKSKQPLEFPSAGSVFKRPPDNFAGKLIEDCGLKGASIGGAMVSEKHAGFIINTGNATSADVKSLVELIKHNVYENYGVELECELKLITD